MHILDAARRDGRVTMEALSGGLGVSPHMIRRDINHPCEEAKLRRLHGGAVFIGDRIDMPCSRHALLSGAPGTPVVSRGAYRA